MLIMPVNTMYPGENKWWRYFYCLENRASVICSICIVFKLLIYIVFKLSKISIPNIDSTNWRLEWILCHTFRDISQLCCTMLVSFSIDALFSLVTFIHDDLTSLGESYLDSLLFHFHWSVSLTAELYKRVAETFFLMWGVSRVR